MRKAERLFQIINVLRSRRTVVTAADLALKLEVSERTIYRDVQALSLSGVPIESEAGVGYRLKSGFSIPPLMFEAEELEALILGARMVQGWSGDQLGRAADSALAKIQAVLPENLHYSYVQQPEWLIVPQHNRQQSSQYSDVIRQAIKERLITNISYKQENGELSERLIWPLGLVYWGKVWTLVAWCQLRQDYRMFRLDRLLSLALTASNYPKSPAISLQDYLAQYKKPA